MVSSLSVNDRGGHAVHRLRENSTVRRTLSYDCRVFALQVVRKMIVMKCAVVVDL